MPSERRMKAKLALLGEGGVGKTSLIRRFVQNAYDDTYVHTVGTRVSKIELTVPHGADIEVHVDLAIFDLMGQKGFKDLIRETYYHGAQALMGVCDLTNKESLEALEDWIPSALEIAGDVPVYFLVNKKDLDTQRAFTDEDAKAVAERFRAPFAFTSAKTGEFVDDAFNALAIEIVDRAMRQERSRTVERPLRERVLLLLAKRGAVGLRRNQFSEILRGTDPNQLRAELIRLESEGLLTLSWHGTTDYTAIVTLRGINATKASASLEE